VAVPSWLPFLVLAILLAALPLATILAWRSGGGAGAWRAAVVIAVVQGLIIIGAAGWLSHPGEALFWVLVALGIAEIAAVVRLWRAFPRL
jgi:hypothetical protein